MCHGQIFAGRGVVQYDAYKADVWACGTLLFLFAMGSKSHRASAHVAVL